MGRKVLITYRVMPKDVDTDLEKIKQSITNLLKEKGEIKDTKEENIAFGLKALKILIMVEDKERIAEEIEDIIKGIEDVESVEVESLTLI